MGSIYRILLSLFLLYVTKSCSLWINKHLFSCQAALANRQVPCQESANQGYVRRWTHSHKRELLLFRSSQDPVKVLSLPRDPGNLSSPKASMTQGWDNRGPDCGGYCFPAELQGTEIKGVDLNKKDAFYKRFRVPVIWAQGSRRWGYRGEQTCEVAAVFTFRWEKRIFLRMITEFEAVLHIQQRDPGLGRSFSCMSHPVSS